MREAEDAAYEPVCGCSWQLAVLIRQEGFPFLLDLDDVAEETTFAELKDLIWRRLSDLSLVQYMKAKKDYYFQHLEQEAFRRVEEAHEKCSVGSVLQPMAGQLTEEAVLLLVANENPSDADEELILQKLTTALGGRQPRCLRDPVDCELVQLAHSVKTLGLCPDESEDAVDFVDWLRRVFPVDLSDRPPPVVNKEAQVCLSVRSLDKDSSGGYRFLQMAVALSCTPSSILKQLSLHAQSDQYMRPAAQHQFVKLCGRMVFLYESRPLWAYKVVQRHLVHHRTYLEIRVVESGDIHDAFTASAPNLKVMDSLRQRVLSRYVPPRQTNESIMSLAGAHKFGIVLHLVDLDSGQLGSVPGLFALNVALTLGRSLLCKPESLELQPGAPAALCKQVGFEISVRDLPRNARLSFAIVEKSRRGKSDSLVAWGNHCVFDYTDRLTRGQVELALWPWERTPSKQAQNLQFNPTGCCYSCSSGSPCRLKFTVGSELPHQSLKWAQHQPYSTFLSQSTSFFDSSQSSILADGASSEEEREEGDGEEEVVKKKEETETEEKEEEEGVAHRQQKVSAQLRSAFSGAGASAEVTEQDVKLFWDNRRLIRRQFPNKLPELCLAIPWRSAASVRAAYELLLAWPKEKAQLEVGLRLLNSSFLDSRVRQLGVAIVERNVQSDDMLYLILMQLVECLKYETHSDSHLARYLLRRAFQNRQIGHHLYYLAKAEMQNGDSNAHRFSLVLEVYLLFSPPSLLDYINSQVSLAHKLKLMVAQMKNLKLDEATQFAQRSISQQKAALSRVWSPAHPDTLLCSLRLSSCRVLDSKMRPLLLSWSKEDVDDASSLIFKSGDDLRQDMLILHCLRLMSYVWENCGLDISLSLYEVVTCGGRQGFIEVVQDADTVAKILSRPDAGKESKITAYLKRYNQEPAQLLEALHRFKRSLVGYSVATYVLGIGDRHCGNIMLRKNGLLFHIDFGHILGNFKYKLGIKRERVPFVLAKEFLQVLSELGKLTDCVGVEEEFRKLCREAYKAIRQRGDLLLNLFFMMVQTGLDELKDTTDLEYLIESLQLEASNEAALRHFDKKFAEAKANNWSVTVNWLFYRMWREN